MPSNLSQNSAPINKFIAQSANKFSQRNSRQPHRISPIRSFNKDSNLNSQLISLQGTNQLSK